MGTLLSEIPVNSFGQASATQSTVRQVGSALGTAVSGSVFSMALGLTLPKTLEAAGIMGPGAAGIAEATRQSAGSAIAELRVQGGHSPFSEQTSVVGSPCRERKQFHGAIELIYCQKVSVSLLFSWAD